jgi:stage V sporulation protein B
MLPAITERLTLNDHAGVKKTEESSARIMGLLALPCSVGLALIAKPLAGLFYAGYRQELAAQAMQILSIGVFLSTAVTYTNTVLQSHNYAHVPVITTLLSGGVRLALVAVFVANEQLGILGVPLAALLCYVCVFALNLIAIAFLVPQKPKIVTSLLRPLLPALLMGAFVFGTIYLMENVLHITSSLLLCAVPVVVGVVIYAVSIVWLNAITREDCLMLPKGEKIAKLLRLK